MSHNEHELTQYEDMDLCRRKAGHTWREPADREIYKTRLDALLVQNGDIICDLLEAAFNRDESVTMRELSSDDLDRFEANLNAALAPFDKPGE